MHSEELHIAYTGGGTGGHVQPIVSLIEYAQKDTDIARKCKRLYRFGESSSLESTAAANLEEVTFVSIIAGKLRRYWTWTSTIQNIGDMVKVVGGFWQSLWKLRRHEIDVVFCKGGYVALPVCRAARVLRIPVYLHESDLHPGLTNRLVGKLAQERFVGFPDTFQDEIVTGQILSSALLDASASSHEKTQLLVMGGSQGSVALVSCLVELLRTHDLSSYDIHVVLGTHQDTHTVDFAAYEFVMSYGYVPQSVLADLYARTDIALTRAGVTSLAEQQLFGIQKIIVPHPRGGGYHQLANALWYVDQHDDILVEEGDQRVAQIAMFLEKLQGYKKPPFTIDAAHIEQAKQTIWSYLLGVKN